MTALIVLLIALQIADGLTTWAILHHGGRELNPTVRWAMDKLGMAWGLIAAKAWVIGCIVAISFVPGGNIGLAILAIFYGLIVASNVRVYLRLTKD